MPIYAYKCASCGYAKDVLQKMSDPLLTVCPQCGKPTFQKQVTAAGFQLKGTGWYVTDFRGGSGGTSVPGSSPDHNGHAEQSGHAKGDAAKSEAKSDSASHAGSGSASSGAAAPSAPPSTPSSSGGTASGG